MATHRLKPPPGAAVLALGLALLPVSAAAGDYVVQPIAVDELKAVFGEVQSRDTVPARARISGTVESINVVEGSEVETGDLIATVVDDKLALQRDAAEAQIKALTAQLANARTDLDRAQQLLGKGAVAQSRVDQAQTQVDVYSNQLAAANAQRAVVEQQLNEGHVLAPASGRVLTVPLTHGSVVLAGEVVVRIAGGGYFLRLSLPERHAGEIKEGAKVRVGRRELSPSGTGDTGTVEEGVVARVYPEIADGRVLADVEVPGLGDYFVGERTLVWIPVGRRSVLAVPPGAIATRHGIDYVRVAASDGPIDVAVIPSGPLSLSDSRVEIVSGLAPGDHVILP
jgi:RND family efflux transporter MFP subunit